MEEGTEVETNHNGCSGIPCDGLYGVSYLCDTTNDTEDMGSVHYSGHIKGTAYL